MSSRALEVILEELEKLEVRESLILVKELIKNWLTSGQLAELREFLENL